MSAQRLNAKSVRRIERTTGLSILRGWAHGGYVFAFVTEDHRHGFWRKKDQTWGWDAEPTHYSSCDEMFPDWDGEAEFQAQRVGATTVLEGRVEVHSGSCTEATSAVNG